MSSYKFIISGGGTGGHIYPAIAIADELKKQFPDAEFLFVGASDKMEMEKVPQCGYTIEGLWIAGLQRKLTFSNLLFPVKVISSLLRAKKIIRKFKPDVAIGTGGFASGPLLQMATSAGVPSLIQEQNSFPGITNKLLAKKADVICVAYDGLERFFPTEKIIKTGNPVRQDLLNINEQRNEALAFFELDKSKKTLLVIGGSLGASRINKLIEKELAFFNKKNVQVIWQCGKLYENAYLQYNGKPGVQVRPFIREMNMAYAAADIIISRAGASSVSELCIVGKPVIFIPSPNVAEDHQTKNARSVANEDAAVVIKEQELDAVFQMQFERVLIDENYRQTLSENIKKLALPNATKDIVEEIKKLLN